MSDDLSKVDWTRPIEAVNDCDGRVVVLTLASSCPDKLAYYWTTDSPAGDANCYWKVDGSNACNPNWRIRNVAEVPWNSKEPSDPIAKRMEALVRALAESRYGISLADEARAIVALLPEPVDADLVEAREMAIDLMSKTVIANGNPQAAPEIIRIREGKGDTNSYVVACLAAIRRGRALERDSREG
ncbi:hypothetical protein V3I01_08130 [Sphingomonas sp. gentR]|uniref:hypothetical protein n=1 Tax=Sphingomonas sp. gentR TaxID=3118768 RepID=UPI0030D62554